LGIDLDDTILANDDTSCFYFTANLYFFLSGSRKKKGNKKERLPAPVPELKMGLVS